MSEPQVWLAAFRPQPLHTYLDEAVRAHGDRPAVDFMGKGWSYSEIGAMADRVAAGLQAQGIAKGDKVGLCLPNTPYYPVFYFATLKIGAVVVNFNPLYVEREIEAQARDAGVRVMVTMDLKVIYDKVEAVRRSGGLDTIIVCPMADILPQPKKLLFQLFKGGDRASIPSDGAHPKYDELTSRGATPHIPGIVPEQDVAVLQYTGGTTGTPKAAMLTHANLSANIEQMRALFHMAVPGRERMLCVLPFFHVFAMTVAQNLSVAIGAEMVLMPRFELKALLDTIRRKSITLFPGVPTLFTAINTGTITPKYDLTSIKLCISGGAPLPVEVKEQFETLTGCMLVEGYGLTEASPVVAVNPFDERRRAGSIGYPLPGTTITFHSLDDPDVEMPAGEKGELVVRGPQVMAGYYQREHETGLALRNGALHTGDVGYRDEDGFIFLVDRIKDLILCSGYNVYPRMIEDAIYRHPAVEEAIVIAIPDAYRGQAPKAFVKLRPGESVNEEEMKTFLKDHLSRIEMPQAVEFRDALPKTMVGKLSKKELVAEEADRHDVS
ncbi:long-chain fatty acid--CoA ligase [Stappia sp.]|uniref:long-chain-fatty-acid--CoA ligase n=2 Tax=Stappia sp. TaxID=1870903 RepID=UPI002600EA17|nr:long-chain fatty acid--CoA ligase [Stappia sp.]